MIVSDYCKWIVENKRLVLSRAPLEIGTIFRPAEYFKSLLAEVLPVPLSGSGKQNL